MSIDWKTEKNPKNKKKTPKIFFKYKSGKCS